MKNIYENIFTEFEDFITLNEAAYLGIENGELIPIYKRDTHDLKMDDWVIFHRKYRSFVEDSAFLIELVKNRKISVIRDTNKLPKKPVEFEALNIRSIYLFPVVINNEVAGIIDIAFREECYNLTHDQIKKCEKIIEKYKDRIY